MQIESLFQLLKKSAPTRPALSAILYITILTCGAQSAQTHAQTALTVAAFPAVDAIVKAAIPEWTRRHPDVTINLISRQYADHHTAMTTALSTRSYLPDVMVLEVNFVGRFMRTGALDDLRLPPYYIERERSRIVPYAYNQVIGLHGEVGAIPTDIGPGTLLFRSDILAQAGVSEADLTRSWDSYVESGLKIKSRTGAFLLPNARDIKDILIRTGIQPDQGIYFDNKSHVLVNSQRFVRAFSLALKVRRNQLDARVLPWSSDWAEGFKRGSIATQMSGAWLAGHLSTWIAPNTSGHWRASQLPEGAFAAWGGSYFVIAKESRPANKQLAWEFIRMLTLEPAMQLTAFKEQNAFPALMETYSDPFFDEPISFLGGQRARVLWRDAAMHIGVIHSHKQDVFAEEVINTELDKVLDKNKDIHAALQDAEHLLERRALR